MPETVARREIEKEAENHIALGRLLRKERAEPRKTAVKKILASELSVPQKIEKIREVDETGERPGGRAGCAGGSGSGRAPPH